MVKWYDRGLQNLWWEFDSLIPCSKKPEMLKGISVSGFFSNTNQIKKGKTITSPARTITVYSKSSRSYNSFLGKYNSSNESVLTTVPTKKKVTSLKSTNTSVVSLTLKNGSGSAKGYRGVFLTAKKSGTATVSYKIGSNTYKTKIVVKKYASPFSALKLGSSNILSKFRSNSVYTMSYTKYKNKSLKLSYKAKSGWSVSASYLYQPGNQKSSMVKNNKSFKITKKNSALILNAYNSKTKQNEQCIIIFK